jgi:hypothetical protein
MTELTLNSISELRQSMTANIESLEQTLEKERSKHDTGAQVISKFITIQAHLAEWKRGAAW